MKKSNYPYNLRINLYRRFRWFEYHLLEQVRKSKYNFLTLSEIRVFAFLQGRDKNISDLAKLMNISRQAVQKRVSRLLDWGLLEITQCPKNFSAKLITPTDEGRKVQIWAQRAARKAEKDLGIKIGPEKVMLLNDILNDDWD